MARTASDGREAGEVGTFLERVGRALLDAADGPAARRTIEEALAEGEAGVLRAIEIVSRSGAGEAGGSGGTAEDDRTYLGEILEALRGSLHVVNVDFRVIHREGHGPGDHGVVPDQRCYQQVFGRDRRCPFCPAKSVFETGEPARVVTPVQRIGDEDKIFEIHSVPLKGPDGEVRAAIELMRDVTEEKELEERFQASEKLAAVGRLAAGIAHEIKNPLGIILASSEILTNSRRPAEQRTEASEILMVEVERLSNIVNDFLKYARPGPMRRRECRLNDLIHETVSVWSAGLQKQERAVICEDLDPSLPEISIDPDQLRQVILNLLINAHQSTGPEGRLSIETRGLDDGGVELSFIDDGPGIDREVRGKIFEPFFTTKEEGTGLGLSIVKRIVDEHQGRIEVEGLRPRGTAFRVRLPGTPEGGS